MDKHYYQTDINQIIDMQQREQNTTVWKGDKAIFSLPIASKTENWSNVGVTISDFEPTNKNKKQEQNSQKLECVVSYTKETKTYIGRGGSWDNEELKVAVPDILSKDFPLSLPQNTVTTIWVEINIPNDIQAGQYTSSVIIKNNDQIIKQQKITLQILDIDYPTDKTLQGGSFGFELWQYPYTVARYYGIKESELFQDKHLGMLTKHLQAYKQAGGDTICATITEDPWNTQTYDPYPSMIKWQLTDKGFVFDYTHFDTYVQLAMDNGIDKSIKSFSMLPWKNRLIYTDKNGKNKTVFLTPGSKKWNNYWGQFLASYIQHLDKKGWFDKTYISIDERPLRQISSVIALINKHKNKDGKSLKIAGALNYSSINRDITDYVDDISIGLEHIAIEGNTLIDFATQRRLMGYTTTMYTCVGHYPNSFALSDPIESVWTMLYAQKQQLDGYLRWAFDAWNLDPLKDLSYKFWEGGDFLLMYPSDNNSDFAPQSTPRFQRLQEGYRYVQKARFLIGCGGEIGQKTKILIDSLGRKDGKVNKYGAMYAKNDEDKQYLIEETYRIINGLNDLAKEFINNGTKASNFNISNLDISTNPSKPIYKPVQNKNIFQRLCRIFKK